MEWNEEGCEWDIHLLYHLDNCVKPLKCDGSLWTALNTAHIGMERQRGYNNTARGHNVFPNTVVHATSKVNEFVLERCGCTIRVDTWNVYNNIVMEFCESK